MFLTRLIKFILVHSWVTWNAYPVLSIKEHDAYGLKPSTHGIKKTLPSKWNNGINRLNLNRHFRLHVMIEYKIHRKVSFKIITNCVHRECLERWWNLSHSCLELKDAYWQCPPHLTSKRLSLSWTWRKWCLIKLQ